jgi:type I restriction enzyme R subunit
VLVETLSQIIDVLNERFGLGLDEADQLLFDQFEETWTADPDLAAQAKENTLENFRLVFDPKFLNTIVTRMDANDAIFKQILDDSDFREVLSDYYLRKVYARIRGDEAA